MISHEDLIQRYLEDRASLSEQDLDLLIEHLRANPAEAVRLHEHLILDDYLAQKLGVDRGNFSAQVEQRIADFEQGEEEVYSHVAELRAIAEAGIEKPFSTPPSSPWLKYSMATAVIALFAVSVVVFLYPGQKEFPIATIEQLSGDVKVVRKTKEVPVQIGKVLYTDDLVEAPVGSAIAVRYKDRTELHVLGGSTLKVGIDRQTGGKRVSLSQGELTASVTPQTSDAMVFTTPHAKATVLGTELRLSVRQNATRLDVQEGKVGLMRLSDGQSVMVATNGSGEASAEGISLRDLTWPIDRREAIFVFEPGGAIPLARNPETGNLRQTEWEPARGDASIGNQGALILAGGSFVSSEAGIDLLPFIRQKNEFTLDIALVPAKSGMSPEGQIIGFAMHQELGNLVILQQEEWLFAGLQTSDSPQTMKKVNLGKLVPGKLNQVTITYRSGELAGYVGRDRRAATMEVRGDLTSWKEGKLVVGADEKGDGAWQGTVAGIAIYSRALSADEVVDNQQRFVAKFSKILGEEWLSQE